MDRREQETQSLVNSLDTANLAPLLDDRMAIDLDNFQSQFWGAYNSGFVCWPRDEKHMTPELKKIMDRWAKDYFGF